MHVLNYNVMYTCMHSHSLNKCTHIHTCTHTHFPFHTHLALMLQHTHTTSHLTACTGSAAIPCVSIPPSSRHTHLVSWTRPTRPTTSTLRAWPATSRTSSVGSTRWERETGALLVDSLIAWTLANQWITGCRFEHISL